MSSVTTRRPRVKPAVSRLARLEGNFLWDGFGLLTLIIGGIGTDYTLERIGSDFGDGFALVKHIGSSLDDCDIYHVHLSDEGHTCDCKGGTYSTPRTGKPCKHTAALVALREAGRI